MNNAISAAKILGNFVAAWILVKLGPKWTVSLSCLLTCAVIVGGPSPPPSPCSFSPGSCWGSGAVLMICMTPYVVYCFESKQQPIFIGLNNAGPNGRLLPPPPARCRRGMAGFLAERHPLLRHFQRGSAGSLAGRRPGVSHRPNPDGGETPTTIYHYRDGMKEPFLFQFLFTMTGRLVMYTVMLYLFP